MDGAAMVDAAVVAANVSGLHGDDNNDGALRNDDDALKMAAPVDVAVAVVWVAGVEVV